MRRFAISLFGLVVMGLLLPVSRATAEETENHKQLEKTAGWLVGAWRDADGPRAFKWELGKQVITWIPQDPEEARGILYWDPAEKKVKLIGFGAAGWLLTGVMESVTDKQVKFSVVNTFPSGHTLHGVLTYTLNAANKMTAELVFQPSKDHDQMLPNQTWKLTRVD